MMVVVVVEEEEGKAKQGSDLKKGRAFFGNVYIFLVLIFGDCLCYRGLLCACTRLLESPLLL